MLRASFALGIPPVAMAGGICGLGGCGGRLDVGSQGPETGANSLDAAAVGDATSPRSAADGGGPEPVDAGTNDASRPQDADADALPIVMCDAGQPLEVCVEYFALLSSCTGENVLYGACQPAFIPDGGDDQYIEQVCTLNLQRLQQACR